MPRRPPMRKSSWLVLLSESAQAAPAPTALLVFEQWCQAIDWHQYSQRAQTLFQTIQGFYVSAYVPGPDAARRRAVLERLDTPQLVELVVDTWYALPRQGRAIERMQAVRRVLDQVAARLPAEQAALAGELPTLLGVLGHELRSPLTAIRGHIQLAQRPSEGAPPRVLDSLVRAERQTLVLGRLIQDLQDVARLSAGTFHLQYDLCNAAALIEAVVSEHRLLYAGRDIQVAVPEEPVFLRADAMRLLQVLNNYLTNALKYAPVGAVLVGATLVGKVVRVWVADNGPGLSTEEQDQVWDRFYQVPGRPGWGLHPGMGLGLYICRRIIEAHQGQVGVESAPGQGACFWFALPLAEEIHVQHAATLLHAN